MALSGFLRPWLSASKSKPPAMPLLLLLSPLLLLSFLPVPCLAQDDGGDMGDDGSSAVDPSLLMEDESMNALDMQGGGPGRRGVKLSLQVGRNSIALLWAAKFLPQLLLLSLSMALLAS